MTQDAKEAKEPENSTYFWLQKLVRASADLITYVSKAQTWGLNNMEPRAGHPDYKLNNTQLIGRELANVKSAAAMVEAMLAKHLVQPDTAELAKEIGELIPKAVLKSGLSAVQSMLSNMSESNTASRGLEDVPAYRWSDVRDTLRMMAGIFAIKDVSEDSFTLDTGKEASSAAATATAASPTALAPPIQLPTLPLTRQKMEWFVERLERVVGAREVRRLCRLSLGRSTATLNDMLDSASSWFRFIANAIEAVYRRNEDDED